MLNSDKDNASYIEFFSQSNDDSKSLTCFSFLEKINHVGSGKINFTVHTTNVESN